MGSRNATFVDCDRCGATSEHVSPEYANKETMQLQITGSTPLYVPRHEDPERAFLCTACGEDFREWWRARRAP